MKAWITGITGQDGSYLSELLLEQAMKCTGLFAESPSKTRNIDSGGSVAIALWSPLPILNNL
jgi:GDP-D-mannose dehydratase